MKRVISILVCLFFASDSFAGLKECSSFELIKFRDVLYNNIVCKGIEKENIGDLKGALKMLEEAAKLNLFEEVNVYLYPRLAILHYQIGDKKVGLKYLNKSLLAIELMYGLSKCEMDYEYSPGVELESLYAKGQLGILRHNKRLDSDEAQEIYFEMCQENLIDTYSKNIFLNSVLISPFVMKYKEALTIYKEDRATAQRFIDNQQAQNEVR